MKIFSIHSARMRSLFLLLTLVCLFPVVSCKRIALYDPQSGVYLKLDLKLNTDVKLNDDIDLEGDAALREKVYGKMPEQVRACFYDAQTYALVAEEFLPPTGGFVNVPAGTYDIIVYSLGTEVTQVKGTEIRGGSLAYRTPWQTQMMEITTKNEDDHDGQPTIDHQQIIDEPDHIFVGTKENVMIPVRSTLDKTMVIEMEMTTLLDTYSLEVRNIQGAERIKKIDVYITGQAQSKYMWSRNHLKICTLYFPSKVNVDKGKLYTVFNTFGKFPGARNNVKLDVRITGVDGGYYQWSYDVTDQFDNPDNINHALVIDDDDIYIPKTDDAGGFRPEVKDWTTEIIHVPLS